MFQLDFRSRMPIYEQLIEKFKECIINNILKADEKLPSVRELAKQLSVNPNTIQKAYRELERQGFIYSIKGKGSFVHKIQEEMISEKLKIKEEELKKLLSEMFYLGEKKERIIKIVEEIDKRKKEGQND